VSQVSEAFEHKLAALQARRDAAGGVLSQEEESDAAAELESYWDQMSDEEQAPYFESVSVL